VQGRDATTVARTLFATPLRVGADGRLRGGLCTEWHSRAARRWTLRCRHAGAIAAELRRVPSLLGGARISARGSTVRIDLSTPWPRLPWALTAVAAAPPGVPGPFRLVSGSRDQVVVRRGQETVVFRRMEPHAALRAFQRRELDEAPVPVGDVRALRGDPALHVRPLEGLDVVSFDLRGGVLADLPNTRRAYWATANRGDYEALVAEYGARAAVSVVPGGRAPKPGDFRRALDRIPSLPPVAVRIAVPAPLRYGASLLWAQWHEAGLGAVLVGADAPRPDARFRRVVSAYPGALLDAVVGRRVRGDPRRLDARLEADAEVIPVAGVASARLVSPRLHGWRQSTLGDVDYAAVSFG
jgi:hypothetical protein